MTLNNKHILSKEGALQWVKATQHEVIIAAGRRIFDTLIQPIKMILENN